jgi:hypothetical protein
MLDDVLAGIYTNVIIQTIVWFKLFWPGGCRQFSRN